MNDCKFNDSNADIKLIEVMKEAYVRLEEEMILPIEEKFSIFKPFFEGLETGVEIGVYNSGVSEYLVPPILVKIRFIITHVTELGMKDAWELLGTHIK